MFRSIANLVLYAFNSVVVNPKPQVVFNDNDKNLKGGIPTLTVVFFNPSPQGTLPCMLTRLPASTHLTWVKGNERAFAGGRGGNAII